MAEGHVLIWAGMLLQRSEKREDEEPASSIVAQKEHMGEIHLDNCS